MSEYWKSNPRKFCDFCKCWIADNKPSIDFHERGKRHKDNVQKRLAEMGRKGQEDYEAKLQEQDFLKSMEEAAMKAYKNDVEQNPDMTGAKINEIAKANNAELVVGKKKSDASDTTTTSTTASTATTTSKPAGGGAPKVWHEAKSPDGTSYYWNTESGESTWDVPKDGFLSVKEQERLTEKTTTTNHTASADKSSHTIKKKSQTTVSSAPMMYGPAPKAVAYSTWQTVKMSDKKEAVDLQLPQIVEEGYYAPEVVISKPEVSFKEKVVTLSDQGEEGGQGSVGFKKRKAQQDSRKFMKRRNDL
ncbi:hypothetical protein O3P69_007586 [Scylla paramamosain]|uniref:WW domain-binding protein 4 n=2 Tax=Scylla paramamosain TaxID=85552 RepID=A0AAW0V0E4_SCYPA